MLLKLISNTCSYTLNQIKMLVQKIRLKIDTKLQPSDFGLGYQNAASGLGLVNGVYATFNNISVISWR